MASPRALTPISDQQLRRLHPYLDEVADRVEQPDYIETDPIRFLYDYRDREDRLLAGFFAALLAWGRRDIVIRKVDDLLRRMDYRPSDYIRKFSDADADRLTGFKHRTFKPEDIYWLITLLQQLLYRFGDFESFWDHCYQLSLRLNRELISVFHEQFLRQHPQVPQRLTKHVADSEKNSSCKRLYLYLRWTIRSNSHVDTGLMNFMSPARLMIPLDTHVARYARVLGLLTRRQNDWKAVCEVTERLRELNPPDPSRYDYSLFGIGVRGYEIPPEFVINYPE